MPLSDVGSAMIVGAERPIESAVALATSSGLPMPLEEARRRSFSAKETLWHEGDAADHALLIRKGLVKLVCHLPNGRARIVRLQCAEQWIGLEGLLDPTYRHRAIAISHVEAEHHPIRNLKRLKVEEPSDFCRLLYQWHEDLVQAEKWIAEFSTGCIRSRVARLLEYLAQLEFGAASRQVELLTVHEMAEILGVTPESVSRVLASFKRSDLLHRQIEPNKDVFRIDSDRLGHVARQ